jgi:hypothetical protein
MQTLASYGDRTYYIYIHSSQTKREGHACKCKQAKENKSSTLYRAPKQNMPNHLIDIINRQSQGCAGCALTHPDL